MIPVGVMYQSPSRKRVVCSHRTPESLDPDRREADHEREPAREEQSGQRGDERLHVEVLDEDADEQPDRGADEDHDRDDHDSGECPSLEQLGAAGSR